MGRRLLAVIKTLLTVITAGAVVIASFYFAYLLLFSMVMIVVGTIAYFYFSKDEIKEWLDYEDPD